MGYLWRSQPNQYIISLLSCSRPFPYLHCLAADVRFFYLTVPGPSGTEGRLRVSISVLSLFDPIRLGGTPLICVALHYSKTFTAA
ncbi:hypothetical protein CC80DRAFT_209956 [Byssothecium circinans]|uniref:Uncharacterized protein n=1 Tax=Byssothecium circinans TaxID=147558 RepID=A0A6A5TEU8_9PLEO|nr:hypothetical protein CC80DRAFT_209956 [Byssothecium circinans]